MSGRLTGVANPSWAVRILTIEDDLLGDLANWVVVEDGADARLFLGELLLLGDPWSASFKDNCFTDLFAIVPQGLKPWAHNLRRGRLGIQYALGSRVNAQ